MSGISPVSAVKAAPAAAPQKVSVGTYNVHNIYDAADDPEFNDPVVPAAEYAARLTKAATAITALGAPDILGVEEVENQNVVNDLLKQPALAGYKAVFMQGNDLWQHNDAFFYRADRVTLDKVEAPNPHHLIGDGQTSVDPRLLFSSPPVIGDFTVTGGGQATEGQKLTVILNHMKSKVGGPGYDERRLAQGNFIGELVDQRTKAAPSVPVIVEGDLNAGAGDPQFTAIMKHANGRARMVDTADALPAADRYSYTYKNQNNLLDHVMINKSAAGAVTGVKIFHFNTRPDPSKIADPASPDGASDHDPVVATFTLGGAAKAKAKHK